MIAQAGVAGAAGAAQRAAGRSHFSSAWRVPPHTLPLGFEQFTSGLVKLGDAGCCQPCCRYTSVAIKQLLQLLSCPGVVEVTYRHLST